MPTKKLLVIDTFNIVFRAFHALPTAQYKVGDTYTNAVFGFSQMLLTLLEKEQPHFVALAWEGEGRTFRHSIYPEYKATRPEQPEELAPQLPLIRQVANVLGIPIFEKAGYEADDVIATLAHQGVKHGLEVVVASGDRDLLQLVGEHISVLSWGQKFSEATLYDIPTYMDKYSFEPSLMATFKALTGDKSDNIAGIEGVGEVTATKLITRFGGVGEILGQVDEIEPERIREKIRAGRNTLVRNIGLVKLVDVGDIGFNLALCAAGQSKATEAVELFKRLKFGELMRRLSTYLTRGPDPEFVGVRDVPGLKVSAPVPAPTLTSVTNGNGEFGTVETRHGLQYQMF